MYDAIMLLSAMATIGSFILALQTSTRPAYRGHSTFKKLRDTIVTKRPDLIFVASISFLLPLIFGGFSIIVIVSFVLLYRTFRTRWDWFPALIMVMVFGSLGWYINANQAAIERMFTP